MPLLFLKFQQMKNILITLILVPFFAFCQKVDSIKVNLNVVPISIRIKGNKPEYIKKIDVIQLSDSKNTQQIKVYFAGCPIDQVLRPFDTTIYILPNKPFDIKLYSFWDTISRCVYPSKPLIVDSIQKSYSEFSSIKEIGIDVEDLKIFPNPTKGILNYTFSNKNKISEIQIHDLTGKFIFTEKESFNGKINISNFQNAHYFITFIIDDKQIKRKINILN